MIHSLNQHERVAALWREAELHLLQANPEDREAARERYVREAVRALESPEHGGFFSRDFSEIVGPADGVEQHYIKRAFKRLVKRGELVKVAPVEGGLLYRLV